MRHTRSAVVVALLALVGSTGCAAVDQPRAPKPAPAVSSDSPAEPSTPPEPEPDALAITPAGVGSLRVGQPAAESELVVYDAGFCLGITGYPDPYDPGRWVPVDPGYPFSVYVDPSGLVETIDVMSSDLATVNGVRRLVSTGDEVRAAYPNLLVGTPGLSTQMYYVSTPAGNLGFEIGDDTMGDAANLVINIRITSPGEVPAGWNSSDAMAGGCL